jgi:dihydrofolate reductase
MARIVVSQNITLDGVVQDPTGDEGFRLGGWFTESMNGDYEAWAQAGLEEALNAEAFLVGRRSDEYFGTRWNTRTGVWADRLNSIPKYVVSSTLVDPVWVNSTVIGGDVAADVARLKRDLAGDIIVAGSRQLARAMFEHGLVDELRLIVFPVVLGEGERLFGGTDDGLRLRRRDARAIGAGLAHVTYDVVREG